jgi:hypothetical protein
MIYPYVRILYVEITTVRCRTGLHKRRRDEFRVGPHIMILELDQKMLQALNQDGSNGQPYVNHLPELFLVIPICEWNGQQAVRTVDGITR